MKIDEGNFILGLINKNEKALDYVIDNYGWIIKSIVKKHLYNLKSTQEECINDILLGIWNNIKSFNRGKGDFKNWVAGIAKFKCIDYKRKYLKGLEYENIDDLNITIPDNTHQEIIKNELDDDINEILNCLKENDRDLFYKVYIEEKEINDITKEMGVKREVIYNRLSRGKKKIQKIFKVLENRG
ncbi:sigma-70 family RNA polymerase sigma factor [Clostridium weizhouense]|uniref:Sigma-70 family RNA polymerase sigma factor n=1 Tax=Clostridium weizhouense TaxID=2859781 RepID=A0ABS7APU0_9CLOT|nr:sigma-70 family RNA polymerase sigma factor [Clostridium weizhouense]MBW6410639.1 sigma-70 family RNA polymerase sigma factor [Clostridium weizhouense]